MKLPIYNLIRYEYDNLAYNEIIQYYSEIVKRYQHNMDELFAWFMALDYDARKNIGIQAEHFSGVSTVTISIVLIAPQYVLLKRRCSYTGRNVLYISHIMAETTRV